MRWACCHDEMASEVPLSPPEVFLDEGPVLNASGLVSVLTRHSRLVFQARPVSHGTALCDALCHHSDSTVSRGRDSSTSVNLRWWAVGPVIGREGQFYSVVHHGLRPYGLTDGDDVRYAQCSPFVLKVKSHRGFAVRISSRASGGAGQRE